MTQQVKRTPKTLEDSTIVITGGTSGVGLSCAMKFAAIGAKGIVINGRNAERGESACKQVKDAYPAANIIFVQGDSNSVDGAQKVISEAHEKLGSIDALVNSTTGLAGPTLLKDIPLAELASIVTDQMMAPLLTSKLVLPIMSEQGGGSIINIASDAGKVATPGETAIGAAMAAIIMFSRTMAIEAKRNGIRVNVLTPSVIVGTMTNERMMKLPFCQKLFSKAIDMAQLGVCEADDLADTIVFLAGPSSGKITGQAISVNGGISAA